MKSKWIRVLAGCFSLVASLAWASSAMACVINITSPTPYSAFNPPATINVALNHNCPDFDIYLYDNGTQIGKILGEGDPPNITKYYSYAWTGVGSGSHRLTAYIGGVVNVTSNAVDLTVRQLRDAMFVSQSLPATMVAGRAYPADIKMQNAGAATWTLTDGYKLGSQNPQDNGTWGLSRVNVPGNVTTGQTADFNFTVTAPSTPGVYNFQWRMLDEGIAWFGQTTTNVTVTVLGGSVGASPTICTIPSGGATCTSSISWSSNATDAQVWVSGLDGSNLQLFASGQSGSQSATWITASGSRFHLKAGADTLATVDVIGNPSPSVTLTAPAVGATFIAPATMTLTADASDNGSVSKVEFYNGGTKLGEDTSAPYALTWSNVPGSSNAYVLTARAIDNLGAATDSVTHNITVNALPAASLSAPANGASYTAPASITLTATASDSDDGLSKVEFYSNGTKIGEDTTSPYSYVWTGVAGSASPYSVKARAIDTRGAATDSAAINLTVNALPAASLSAPVNGASYTAPASITLTATASDSDDGLSKVEFYSNGTKIGEDTTSPYSYVWTGVAGSASPYSVKARAIDTRGAATDSAAINLTVNALPAANLSAPANGASYTAPASITLTATASDSDDGLSKVEFYSNGTKIGEDLTSPYSYVWSGVAGSASPYSVKARAIDTRGATTDSSAISLTVNALPTISITAPTQNQVFQTGANVVISATASDVDGSLQRVEFYVDGVKVIDDIAAPFSYTWASTDGVHVLSAKAVDNRGAVTTPSTVNVTINGKPSITLTSPATGTAAEPPATLQLSANASDPDGVASVEFFADGISVNTDTTAPYAYDWSNVGSGVHSVYAVVKDTLGGVNTSATATVTVSKVIGHIDGLVPDGANDYLLKGWACSTGLNPSINVHLYVGGAAGSGTFAGNYIANVGSEAAVATACSAQGTAYRFEIPITLALRQQYPNKAIYVHGISLTGGSNLLIAGSGQFTVPVLPSSLPSVSSYSLTETTAYHDNRVNWVLGQVAQQTVNGTVVSSSSFDGASAQPLTHSAFGKLQQSFTYNTDGTLATVKDGNNNVTTLSDWKRGIPQTIAYADGYGESAIVNDAGWITSITDENGYTTDYGYDAMGRLASVVYPTGDSTAWNTTTQVFEPVASDEYGLSAGHWRQTISTGNGKKITYYDAMWRPVVVREYDASDVSSTQRFHRFAYDQNGRVTFASYPGTTDVLSAGMWTEYDALGRVTSVSQDSELGLLTTLTEYLSGFQIRVTDPKLNQTTTSFMAYDQPRTDWPMSISHPQGAYTHISRDAFGKPIQIRRSDSSSLSGGTVMVDRTYSYNVNQELCRMDEPETGATLMGYDSAGNLTWSAAGLAHGQACEDAGDSATVAARRADRTYDARNRIASLSFPDGLGNTAYSYAPDGQLTSLTTQNQGANQVTTTYSYNKRRLLTKEEMVWNALLWSLGYGYDANGNLSSQTYPDNLTVGYAPNALGQATQAGTFATGVSYFPNGAIKQFTYGNGIVHTLTQNSRGLPDTSNDADGTTSFLNDAYDYDANGNVGAITDGATGTGQRGNRTMTYDGLDRLKTTTSAIYGAAGANYTYDVLDNLTHVTLGGAAARDHYYCYDTNWRLTNVKTGSCSGTSVIGLGYDVQGNLDNKNGVTFTFDYGNRLRSVGSIPASSYVYDGAGRRVRDYTTASKYSLYSKSGQLMFTSDGRTSTYTDNIYLSGSLVTLRERPFVGSTVTLKYQHTDALGSPVVVTDADRTVLERNEYEPFGNVLAPASPHDGPGFTGHVFDATTGMNYMQQRYYDPQIGRFLSVDPVTADGGTGSNFNRYKYASNNPYKFTDPDGRADYYNFPNGVVVVIQHYDNKSQFSNGQIEGQASKFNGPTSSGKNMHVLFRPGSGPNAVKITTNPTRNDTSQNPLDRSVTTDGINGRNVELAPNAVGPITAGHELGHTMGAGDQYKNGVDASGHKLSSDVAGSQGSIMRDYGGKSATQQTRNEIESNAAKPGNQVHNCSSMSGGSCK